MSLISAGLVPWENTTRATHEWSSDLSAHHLPLHPVLGSSGGGARRERPTVVRGLCEHTGRIRGSPLGVIHTHTHEPDGGDPERGRSAAIRPALVDRRRRLALGGLASAAYHFADGARLDEAFQRTEHRVQVAGRPSIAPSPPVRRTLPPPASPASTRSPLFAE